MTSGKPVMFVNTILRLCDSLGCPIAEINSQLYTVIHSKQACRHAACHDLELILLPLRSNITVLLGSFDCFLLNAFEKHNPFLEKRGS